MQTLLVEEKQPLHEYGGEVYLHRPHNPRAAQAWTKAWGKGHMRMHEWAGYRNPGRAPTEPCSLLWGNEQSLEHMLKGKLDYPRTSREIRDSPRPLGNKDGEALGRRIQSPAEPELGGSRRKHKIPALIHETAMPAGSRVCPEKDRLLWGVQGS